MLAPIHDIFFALPFGYVFFSFVALLMLPCPFLISSGRQKIRMSRFVLLLYCAFPICDLDVENKILDEGFNCLCQSL